MWSPERPSFLGLPSFVLVVVRPPFGKHFLSILQGGEEFSETYAPVSGIEIEGEDWSELGWRNSTLHRSASEIIGDRQH